MAWGSEQTATQDTNVGNTWTDAFQTALNPRETLHVQVKADNQSGTVTDAAQVRVLTTLDASTENWDDTPVFSMSYTPSSVSVEDFSFLISGYYKVKVQWRSAGSTDQYTFDADYRLDGVSA